MPGDGEAMRQIGYGARNPAQVAPWRWPWRGVAVTPTARVTTASRVPIVDGPESASVGLAAREEATMTMSSDPTIQTDLGWAVPVDEIDYRAECVKLQNENEELLERLRLRFCLVEDTDCHWYVIPAERVSEWNRFAAFSDDEDSDAPDWARRVPGSPSLVTFNDYGIR